MLVGVLIGSPEIGKSLAHASRVIADWIGFYNHRRPHQALGMKTPAMVYQLAA